MNPRTALIVPLAFSISFILFARTPGPGDAKNAQAVLDAWSRAIGGREKLREVRSLYTKYRVSLGGLSGTQEAWETADGQRRVQLRLGTVLSLDIIYDGRRGWIRDNNGGVRDLAGSELEEQATAAFLAAFSQFFRDRRPGRIEDMGLEDGCHKLLIQPEGGRSVIEYIDAGTGLASKEVVRATDREEITYITEYRDLHGMKIKARTRQGSGDPKYDTLLTLEEARLDPSIDAGLFTRPESAAPGARFPEGGSRISVPFEFEDNNIFMQVKVNGSAPSWFILDTGASATVLNDGRLGTMGLKTEGALEGGGVGGESVDVGVLNDVRFEVGPVVLEPRRVMAIDLSRIESLCGRPLMGALGYDVLSSFVFEIDYARCILNLYDPEGFEYRGKGKALPFTLEGNVPVVVASVVLPGGRSIEAPFLIDSGSGSAVNLNEPFVRRHSLIEALGNHVIQAVGFGVGGESKNFVGRIPGLSLAGFELVQPVARFSQDTRGAGAAVNRAGSIGGEVLRRFIATFDYRRNRLYLEPNAALRDPFEYDMSGLVLTAEGPDLRRCRVYAVMPDSPAAESGLKAGDELVAFDGRPASDLKISDYDRMFLQPGKQFRIEVRRDGKTITAVLRARRRI